MFVQSWLSVRSFISHWRGGSREGARYHNPAIRERLSRDTNRSEAYFLRARYRHKGQRETGQK